MKNIRNIKVRQLVDWKAAIIAGLAGGLVSLATNIILSSRLLENPWVLIRIIASILMGEGVLPPPANFDWSVFLISLFIHLLLSVVFASLIAIVVHQWGIIISFIGGALMGLAFYAIAFYTFSMLYPWFFTFRSWIFLVMYILYGAFTGSVYELLEVEKYVEIKEGGI
jgi:hypothetical protein